MTDPTHEITPGTLLADRYRVIGLLGEGSMGSVYRVHHEGTGRDLALKLLRPGWLDRKEGLEVVRRFEREAKASAVIRSPHVVETFDAGCLSNGLPYQAMELLDGEPLDKIITERRSLSIDYVAEILSQVSEGVDAAHQVGIIHRDLKPENLFVTGTAATPFVKILDFGISKFVVTQSPVELRTRQGQLLGTPGYMSPEQWTGSPVDARSDVYALGIILYECLTGQRPFDAEKPGDIMAKVLNGWYPRARDLREDVPQVFEDLIATAIAIDPAARPASAKDFAGALRQAIDSSRVSAAHPSKAVSTIRSLNPPAAAPVRTVPGPALPDPHVVITVPARASMRPAATRGASSQHRHRRRLGAIVATAIAAFVIVAACGALLVRWMRTGSVAAEAPTPAADAVRLPAPAPPGAGAAAPAALPADAPHDSPLPPAPAQSPSRQPKAAATSGGRSQTTVPASASPPAIAPAEAVPVATAPAFNRARDAGLIVDNPL
jgi:eukaryotic-like serine/threonine-protein kinase